tara:strand:+ start:80 stop:703 length:624 start_codon:yes stop_codon:yes gene_type:complete
MNIKKRLIIFDLDGVLINSISNMRFALSSTEKKINIKLNFNLYKKYLGLPFETIMKKMKIKIDVNKIKKNYEYFSKKKIDKIKINKDILDGLRLLKKRYNLAIFTSKSRSRTLIILKKYKLFKYIVTSDDVKNGKPNPEGLIKIITTLKTMKEDSIFVGDSLYDYKASKSAKIKYLHAMWGYEKNIKKKNCIIKIRKFSDILKIVAN